MSKNLIDLEKTINSVLTTAIKKSEINFDQLYIEIEVENLISRSFKSHIIDLIIEQLETNRSK